MPVEIVVAPMSTEVTVYGGSVRRVAVPYADLMHAVHVPVRGRVADLVRRGGGRNEAVLGEHELARRLARAVTHGNHLAQHIRALLGRCLGLL